MHQNSLVQEECEYVVEEAIVTKEVTETEAGPELLFKEERESVVEEAVVIEEVTEVETAPESPVKEECVCCGGNHPG